MKRYDTTHPFWKPENHDASMLKTLVCIKDYLSRICDATEALALKADWEETDSNSAMAAWKLLDAAMETVRQNRRDELERTQR